MNIKQGFKRPKLLGLGEGSSHRFATPLELFFDLAFVVAIAHLAGFFEHNISIQAFLIVVIKYIAIFIYWNSITMYNQYFEDNTIIHRLLILISMIPILFLTIDSDTLDSKMLLLYSFSFIFSRIYIVIIWKWASSNKRNKYIRQVSKTYCWTYIISAAFAVIAAVAANYEYKFIFSFMWIIILFFEVIYPIWKLNKLNKSVDLSDPNIPVFDRKLQMERTTLFTILILGEGLVATAKLFTNFIVNNEPTLTMAIIILIVTFLMLWIYIDYYSSHTITASYFLNFSYLNLFQTLGVFLIISGLITMFETTLYLPNIIIAIGVILFSITNYTIENHRSEFILEKYEYSNIKYNNTEKLSFPLAQKSFILNIMIAILIFIFPFSDMMISISLIVLFIINIVLIIRRGMFYINQNITKEESHEKM